MKTKELITLISFSFLAKENPLGKDFPNCAIHFGRIKEAGVTSPLSRLFYLPTTPPISYTSPPPPLRRHQITPSAIFTRLSGELWMLRCFKSLLKNKLGKLRVYCNPLKVCRAKELFSPLQSHREEISSKKSTYKNTAHVFMWSMRMSWVVLFVSCSLFVLSAVSCTLPFYVYAP